MNNKNLFYIFLAVFILLGVNFVMAAVPEVTINSPVNDTWNFSSTANVQISYQCSSNWSLGRIAWNATLFIDGAWNKTITGNGTAAAPVGGGGTLANDTANTTIIPALGEGTHTFYISCFNGTADVPGGVGYAGNLYIISKNVTLKVDATAPEGGSITMPATTTIFAQNPIKITCSGSDATAGVNYVKLKITKPNKQTVSYTLTNGEEKILQNLDTGYAGKYLVDCTVYDAATNSYKAGQKSFSTYIKPVSHAAPEVVTPTEEVTPEEKGTTTPTEGAPTEGGEAPSKAWIWIVIGVVVIGIVYFVLKKKR